MDKVFLNGFNNSTLTMRWYLEEGDTSGCLGLS